MCEVNQTQVTNIRLLGFRGLYKFRIMLFAVLLLSYTVILSANTLIIILVTTVDHLKIPMFFFLKHLAAYDILLTTTVVPLSLDIILKDQRSISLNSCLTQFYCLCIMTYIQCYLIAAMSYDRYVAICNPLRYSSLMNSHVFLCFITGFWVFVILLETSEIIVMWQFNYCGLSYIDHFFCDFFPLVALSTSDTSALLLHDLVITVLTELLPFLFIILTYIFILAAILKISSSSGRWKAFSTCSSHLTSVCTFYGSLIIIYMVPSDQSSVSTDKYRTLLYIVVSPLLNPIIYSFRNHEIKKAVKKVLAQLRSHHGPLAGA